MPTSFPSKAARRPTLRVLFMTGYAEQASSRPSFLAPGMDMITKPFTMDDLAARVSGILNEEREGHLMKKF